MLDPKAGRPRPEPTREQQARTTDLRDRTGARDLEPGAHHKCFFKNCPVNDALDSATFSGVPVTTTCRRRAALRAQVDHVVGGLDHVQMVLDQQHRVPGVDQPVQRLEQALDVGQVQTRGRLVEDVDAYA